MKKQLPRCPHCNQLIKQARVLKVDKHRVAALAIAYKWCKEKNRHELKTGDIRHLLTHTQYCTFNDWIRLSSGMVYKVDKRTYGLNLERIEAFFAGKWPVHDVTIDPITRAQSNGPDINVSEIRGLEKLLDENGVYQVQYVQGKLV